MTQKSQAPAIRAANIIRPPTRRSTRTRRALNQVFEPSDESGDSINNAADVNDDDDDFAPSPKRKSKSKLTHGTVGAIGVATQTSPRLLRQLEKEERRRNFF